MRRNWITCLVLLATLFSYVTTQGQFRTRMFWQTSEEFDEDAIIHVGINFHFVNSTYFLKKNTDWDQPQLIDGSTRSFTSITPQSGVGVGMGISAGYKFSKRMELMINPLVKMNSSNSGKTLPGRALLFTTEDDQIISKMNHLSGVNNESAGGNFYNLDVPILLKVKSDARQLTEKNPYNSYRAYLVGGGRWTHLLNANKYYSLDKNPKSPYEVQSPTMIFKTNYFSWEAGAGVELMFRYFKLTPEISFVQSFGNLLDHKKHDKVQEYMTTQSKDYANPFMNSVGFLGIRGWQIRLIFE